MDRVREVISEVQSEPDETGKVLDGYKERITEVLEKERQKVRKDAERESAKIIAAAKQLAQELTTQAEGKAKQEAKEKTKHEIEHILTVAKEESARAVAEARQTAEQQASKIITDSRQEAEKLAKGLMEKATRETEELAKAATELKRKAEQDAVEVREKTREKAEQIIKDAVEMAKTKETEEEHRIIVEAKQKAELIVDEAWSKARETLEEAARTVTEAMRKLDNHIKEVRNQAPEELKHKDESKVQPMVDQEKPESAEPAHREAVGSTAEHQAALFQGSVELEITDGADIGQLSRWVEDLRRTPRLRVFSIGDSASGCANRVLVVSNEPVPLLGILREMTFVKDAVKKDGKIQVTLGSKSGSLLTTSPESTGK